MWIVWILSSAVFLAFYDLSKKASVRDNAVLPVLLLATLLCGQRLMRLRHDRFEWRWTIPATGILLAAADRLYFTGLAIPEVPISVGSLMRRFSVVITFVLGALFFRERNLRRKGVALAAILTGVVLLCF